MTARRMIDWDAEPRLGVLPDVELAAIYGVSKSNVAAVRAFRGIPSPTKAGPRKGSGTKGPGTEHYRLRRQAQRKKAAEKRRAIYGRLRSPEQYERALESQRRIRAAQKQAREQKAVAVARVREVISCCLWGDA